MSLKKTDISFKERYEYTDHPRFERLSTFLESGDPEFSYVHQVFERLVAEPCIAAGILTTLREVVIEDGQWESHPFGRFVGYNRHLAERIHLANDFLTEFERCGSDWKAFRSHMSKTSYYGYYHRWALRNTRKGTPLKRYFKELRIRKSLEKQMHDFVVMYQRMREAPALFVHHSKLSQEQGPLHYYDVPWAIDYMGYIKKRDGAHRVSIAYHLGRKSYPCLVFDFAAVDEGFLEGLGAPPYLLRNFDWYRDLIRDMATKYS